MPISEGSIVRAERKLRQAVCSETAFVEGNDSLSVSLNAYYEAFCHLRQGNYLSAENLRVGNPPEVLRVLHHNLLGEMLLRKGKGEEAVRAFEKAATYGTEVTD